MDKDTQGGDWEKRKKEIKIQSKKGKKNRGKPRSFLVKC